MLILTLDKGLPKERSIVLQTFYERPISNVFTGAYSVQIEKESDIPDVKDFVGDSMFSNVFVVNSQGFHLPISGNYNHIADFSYAYNDENRTFSINLTLNYFVPPVEVQNGE